MIVCHEAADRFFDWLTAYDHGPYHDVGDALACWLVHDSGVRQLADDYSIFLLTTISVLLDSSLAAGVTVRQRGGRSIAIHRPKEADWIDKIGPDVFARAVVEVAAWDARFPR
ncbi:MAG: hypothetical protein QHJ34_15120 [bacterium]|jgi:hypothetical protein|nr:hypothetical protein [candidate division KSB1 bacterium]MDH7561533.1 hypothetical protein [bacterium]